MLQRKMIATHLVLTISFLLSAVHAAMPVTTMTLASQGTTDVVIVTPREPSPSVARAAKELQTFLGQITGAEFPCVTERQSSAARNRSRRPRSSAAAGDRRRCGQARP